MSLCLPYSQTNSTAGSEPATSGDDPQGKVIGWKVPRLRTTAHWRSIGRSSPCQDALSQMARIALSVTTLYLGTCWQTSNEVQFEELNSSTKPADRSAMSQWGFWYPDICHIPRPV